MFSIAKQYNVEVENLANWNGINGNQRLKINDKIALKPTQGQRNAVSSVTEQKDGESKTLNIKNIYYTVNSGDTISAIAKNFSNWAKKSWNEQSFCKIYIAYWAKTDCRKGNNWSREKIRAYCCCFLYLRKLIFPKII